MKPFSQAIYGNYRLVEALGSNLGSPLDIRHETVWSWDASQLEAYCGAVLITLKSYLESGAGNQSYSLYRALENIENSCRDVYKLNDISSDYYSTDIFKRLDAAVDFVVMAIRLIGQQQNLPKIKLRVRDDGRHHQDLYDDIANLMFEIIFSAASVKGQSDKCWSIHYGAVWSNFFDLSSTGGAWKIVHFKLRRLLYDEIVQLEKFQNYKSSRILGFCLNVMGLRIGKKKEDRGYYSLHKVILAWTRKNYLRLKSVQPDVAESCLMGSISFDAQEARLVKTFARGLSLTAPENYLELMSPPAET